MMLRVSVRRQLYATWLAYVLAWFLPVVKDGITLREGLPGWQALRVALDPVWPYEGIQYDIWWAATLAVLSAATNLLMLASPLVLAVPQSARVIPWLAWTAVVVNAHWYVLHFKLTELRPGYVLWWVSFLGLALATRRWRLPS